MPAGTLSRFPAAIRPSVSCSTDSIARWARGWDALACRRGADRSAVGFVQWFLPAVSEHSGSRMLLPLRLWRGMDCPLRPRLPAACPAQRPRRRHRCLAGVTLLTAGIVHIALAHGADMQRYAVNQPVRMMSMANWQQGGWTELPVRRVDLLGEYEEPFAMQWAGPLSRLRAVLSADGWTAPVPWTLRSSLEWLSPRASPGSLPASHV